MALAPPIPATSLRRAIAFSPSSPLRLKGAARKQCAAFSLNPAALGMTSIGASSGRCHRPAFAAAPAAGVAEVEVGEEKPGGVGDVLVFPGRPTPLGATASERGVNFTVFSSATTAATLCLFTTADLLENTITLQIRLDPQTNKTGDVWHIFVEGDLGDILYGYKFDGKFSPKEGHYFDPKHVVLDPYAKAVLSRGEYGILQPGGSCWPQMAGMVSTLADKFDWEGDLPLNLPTKDLIIYEMHVRGFSMHESSGTNYPGTYLGVVEKLDYF